MITFEPTHEKTNNLGFRPDPTQTGMLSQKQARSLRFWIEDEEELYYLCSENKDADQLCVDCTAESAPLFSHMQVAGFPMRWLNYSDVLVTDSESSAFKFVNDLAQKFHTKAR